MRIEQATLEDCREIAGVHILSWQHAYRDLLPTDFLASLSIREREVMWHEALAKGTPQFLVAKDEGKVVGFAAFGPSRDPGAQLHAGEVWAIYLAPSHWSRGVGRLLWLASYRAMLAQGFKTISLWVIADNERAIRFYQSAGFELEPASVQEFTLGGVQVQEVRCVLAADA
ncbi:MAG: GNAT family N-acetyltransferase [Burkholderiaceae bacterium]